MKTIFQRLVVLAALSIPAFASTNLCVTTASGNISVTSNWTCTAPGTKTPTAGIIPASGDVVIQNHNLTVNQNWTVGNSPRGFTKEYNHAPITLSSASGTTGGVITALFTNAASGDAQIVAGDKVTITGTTGTNGLDAAIYGQWVTGTCSTTGCTLVGSVFPASGTLSAGTIERSWAIRSNGVNLTVNTGVTLDLQGPVGTFNTHVLAIQQGAALVFDASLATTPLSQTYGYLSQPQGNTGSGVFIGTSGGTRVSVSSNVSGGNGYFLNNNGDHQWTSYNTDFLRVGDANNGAFSFAVQNSGNEIFLTKGDTLNATGGIVYDGYVQQSDTSFNIVNDVFSNTLGAFDVRMGTQTANTTGSRLMTGNVFDKQIKLDNNGLWGFTVTGNYFNNGWAYDTVNGKPWATFTNNFVRTDVTTQDNAMTAQGDMSGSYFFYDWPAHANPHWMECAYGLGVSTVTISNSAFEFDGPDPTGNVLSCASNPSINTTYVMDHNLILPNTVNQQSGVVIDIESNNANAYQTATHNTIINAGQGSAEVGHFQTSTMTGHYVFKNNLDYSPLPATSYCSAAGGYCNFQVTDIDHFSSSSGLVTDLFTVGNLDYNFCFNCQNGFNVGTNTWYQNTNGYAVATSSPAGVHDVYNTADPRFVSEATAHFVNVMQDLFGTTSGSISNTTAIAGALTGIQANVAGRLPLVLSVLRRRFTPTTLALKKGSSDGQDFGATSISTFNSPGANTSRSVAGNTFSGGVAF